MNVLMISFLAFQVVEAFDKVLLLRTLNTNDSNILTCVAEDNGDAFVWNTFSNGTYDMDFYSTSSTSSFIDCQKPSQYCQWNRGNWRLGDSLKHPLGLVLDNEWEGFEEINNVGSLDTYVQITSVPLKGSFPFSLRGKSDFHLILCGDQNYTSSFCYWIVIAGKKSAIRHCPYGINRYSTLDNAYCNQKRAFCMTQCEELIPTEWRHFLLTWDNIYNITLYDKEKMLLTFALVENTTWDISKFYISYKSSEPVILRHHNYNFLYTNEIYDLNSPYIQLDNNTFCLRLAIGLCDTCSVEMKFVEASGLVHPESSVSVEGKPAIHGLPTWQRYDLRMTVNGPITSSQMRIRIVPTIKNFNDIDKGFWAIRDITQCPAPGTKKIGNMMYKVDHADTSNEAYQPKEEVTCQRISYNRNEVVGFAKPITTFLTDDYNCPKGPLCSISCDDLNENFEKDCKNVAICETRGCTCNAGITGNRCEAFCGQNHHGYACKETCGQCFNESCDYKTGLCLSNTCINTDVQYVPPYCKIGIHKPAKPRIDYYNETYVRVSLDSQDEYMETKVEYAFVIYSTVKPKSEEVYYQPIDQNTQILKGEFSNLNPGTLYWISCYLLVKEENYFIYGHSTELLTHCTDRTNLRIVPGTNNLTITDETKEPLMYTCPLSLYFLIVLQLDTTKPVVYQDKIPEMPFTLKTLQPGTSYKVIIVNNHTDSTVLSRNVNTTEGIPSKVQNITSSLSDYKVDLQWQSPKMPNGKIIKYEVTLEVVNYLGCTNSADKNSISENKIRDYKHEVTRTTNITFFDLHPYTLYNATVYAWNSNRGKAASKRFTTSPTTIPRSKYVNLTLENEKLLWELPEDCSTITGWINVTRLIFVNVNNNLESTKITKQTVEPYFNISTINLYGDEMYKVYVYPLRNYGTEHNSSAYAELEFNTPAKAPPKVRNLEIFEFDTNTNSISFRWQKPYPPNGKLDNYVMYTLNWRKRDKILYRKIPKDKYCQLWKDYNCEETTVTLTTLTQLCMYAKNKNVQAVGDRDCTIFQISKKESDQPKNVTVRMYDKNTVELSWLHPWKTGLPLKKFRILTNIIKTKLNLEEEEEKYENLVEDNFIIEHYQPRYTMRLNVLPSTLYEFYVYPVNYEDRGNNYGYTSIETPASIGFNFENLTHTIHSDNITCVHVPKIVNDTTTSRIYFVVKGNDPCKGHIVLTPYLRQRANVKDDETAWLAASFPAKEYSDKDFCIGNNEKDPANCPLRKDEFYSVIVMVDSGKNSTSNEIAIKSIYFGVQPRRHDEKWIVPLVVILLIFGVICYACPRRTQHVLRLDSLQENIRVMYDCRKRRISMLDLPKCERTSVCNATDINVPLIEETQNNDDSFMPIKVKDFEDYVKNAISTGLLNEQYEMIPRGLTRPCDYGQLPENKSKNRYRNLTAYDETRVVLKKLQDEPFSDYINANYITGYKKEKRYIATQGPKANTVIDFWRMVWQENVFVICMLASVYEHGKAKCEQYWPEIGKKKKYGDMLVFNYKQDVFADYIFRTLYVTYDDETRQVTHLHYTAWPDHGIPMYTHSVVTYLKKLLAIQVGNGPVVVHCSAGVGRTGTIILCDICLRRAAVEGVIDVLSEMRSIRNERVNMVDNKEQYLFAHLLLIECLLALPTSLSCNDTLPARINDMKQQLHVQLQRVEDTAWQDEALKPSVVESSLSDRNIAKNRYVELASGKFNRVYLKRYPPEDRDSDYIAGVYVDGLKVQRQYLASQLPLPSTFNDFWRMIAELKVELIVMLQSPDPNDPSCCPVIPTDDKFQPTPYITVTTKDIEEKEHYVYHKLFLVDNSEPVATNQSVTILCSTKWEPGRNKKPPATNALVALWEAAERISRVEIPTVVLCHDGVTGCGLYLALNFLLERMAIEKECDVCLAIRIAKRSRSDFVRSAEQMEYLYDAALTYIKYFPIYANFSSTQ